MTPEQRRRERAQPVLPPLPLDSWQDTCTTLHLWTQIVGKIRLALSPMENQWWQVTLYPSARGLTTSAMFSEGDVYQIDFDFIDHMLRIEGGTKGTLSFSLVGLSVGGFYREIMAGLKELGASVSIWPVPVEVEEQIPFDQDEKHASYDGEAVGRYWQVLLQVTRMMKVFRVGFTGKASPVHLFWGSFDLATTRFNGRPAPLNEHAYHVAKYVMEEAYIEECSSCGFWPGDGLGEPAFYAYHYPEPAGYRDKAVQPASAYYNPELGEYILPYEALRKTPDWERTLQSFFQTTYEAGASLAGWEREKLERRLHYPGNSENHSNNS